MIRLLPHDEYPLLLEPIQLCFGPDKQVPSPEVAPLVAVEEDEEGNIKGFLFLQLAFHLEPFGSLDHSSFSALRSAIDSALTDIPSMVYYCHSDNSAGIDILKSKGFVPRGILLEGRPKL